MTTSSLSFIRLIRCVTRVRRKIYLTKSECTESKTYWILLLFTEHHFRLLSGSRRRRETKEDSRRASYEQEVLSVRRLVDSHVRPLRWVCRYTYTNYSVVKTTRAAVVCGRSAFVPLSDLGAFPHIHSTIHIQKIQNSIVQSSTPVVRTVKNLRLALRL